MAALFSLIISIIFGKKIISQLNKFQLSEKIRDLDLKGQKEKDGTPTMGGIIIIISILIVYYTTKAYLSYDNNK